MGPSIKHLSRADLSLYRELMRVFGEAFAEPTTYQGAAPSDAYASSLLSKEHFIALAAVDNERVVGGLAAYVLEKFERERKEVYLYDLAVLESHRRRGIATALINTLCDVAKEHGAYVVFVQADPDDTPAIRLYALLGVKENVFHFDIPLNPK